MTHAKNIFTYMLALFSTLALTGCFEDSNDECQGQAESSKTQVELRLAASASSPTRASGNINGVTRATWVDSNAAPEGEMMHNCFVVIVQNGKIQNIVERDFSANGEQEATTIKTVVAKGAATFYSFANISRADIGLEGINSFPAELPAGFDNMYYKVDGNTSSISGNGIPMSNKQTAIIDDNTRTVSLEVIRMMAKVQLQFTNDTGYDLNVKSITLTDITENAANNIGLLPKMEANEVVPNINAAATYADFTLTMDGTNGKEVKNGAHLNTTFYVNESVAHTPNYFVLSINTDKGTVTKRIAMTKWHQIARNDYLVIPVRLVDYRIEIEPQVFTAIGVIPELKYEADRITATFKSYGEFHLKLHVYKRSDNTELTNWKFISMTTLEADPTEDSSGWIYDDEPGYVKRTNTIEGYISPRKGYAIHEINVEINGVTIPYRLQINKE